MSAEIIVAILALAGTCIGSTTGVLAANRLTAYRINQLEKKVDKHNCVIERTVRLEQSVKAMWKWIDEIKEEKNGQ